MNFLSVLFIFSMAVILGMPVRAAPIFAAALGENVDQQAGTLNLGVEGMMLLGTIVGLAVLVYTGSYLLAFLIAGLSAVLLGLFHGLVTITLKADQVVSGTAIWFIGWGLSGYIYTALFKTTEIVVKPVPDIYIPYLTNLPYIGKFLFGEDPVIYLLLIAGIGINFFLYHTKGGLNLRTVGEDPLVAEIMGVNPTLYRYAAIIFGGFMAGIGGAYLTISIVGAFEFDMTAGMGFIAVALVYFAKWKPYRLLLGSLAFGAVYVFYLTIESYLPSIPYQFFEMLPYIVTMVLILYVGSRAHAPAALAMPYIKEG